MAIPGGPVSNLNKYNNVSKGFWAWLRNKLVLVPNRSTGNPIQQTFRVPAPGSQPSNPRDHNGRTLPATDIAENPYYKRDYRRNYPQTSVFNQSSLAGLLLYGNRNTPKIGKGDEGAKQLATIANNEVKLTEVLNSRDLAESVLNNGFPPIPAPLSKKEYRIVDFSEGGLYSSDYSVRTFK